MICPLRTPNRPRKVRLVSFPPVGETCVRSLARPLPSSPQAPYPSPPPLAKAHPFRCGSSPHKSAAFAGAPAIRFAGLLRGPITGASVGVRPPLSGGKIDTWAVPRRAPPWCRQTCQSSAPPWAAWRGIALKGPRPPGLVPADGFSFFASGGDALRWGSFSHARKGTKSAPGARRGLACAPKGGAGAKGSAPGPPLSSRGASVGVRAPLSGVRNTTVRSFHRRPPALCRLAFGSFPHPVGRLAGDRAGELASCRFGWSVKVQRQLSGILDRTVR